jgi:CRISPR/Cas system Type II protein with McrA/HNH and RuvC-like nuclease domain
LKKEGKVFCVWTGKAISSYDVDHMIPFSVWKNNDLWNLLPSQSTTNNQKRDKIPSTDLIEKRKDLILYYWNLINETQSQRFQKEIKVALLGNSSSSGWQESAILQLQRSCNYLIANRGYEEWKT